MQLVEEGQHILGNGLCFLCETQCDRRFPVINTRFDFDPPFQSPLVGPKYVCSFCADSLGRLVGLVPAEDNKVEVVEVDKSSEHFERIERELAAIRKSQPQPLAKAK